VWGSEAKPAACNSRKRPFQAPARWCRVVKRSPGGRVRHAPPSGGPATGGAHVQKVGGDGSRDPGWHRVPCGGGLWLTVALEGDTHRERVHDDCEQRGRPGGTCRPQLPPREYVAVCVVGCAAMSDAVRARGVCVACVAVLTCSRSPREVRTQKGGGDYYQVAPGAGLPPTETIVCLWDKVSEDTSRRTHHRRTVQPRAPASPRQCPGSAGSPPAAARRARRRWPGDLRTS